ncbi:hypothetical protein AKJ57_02010 [candidate division MSBL1 archaeon SCGC-AAA259A05]|uniref:Carbohydrate kinase PfkB domain-containing protein n=1 Tax=candidate division MSBL1 archaeon SCGC-AAA259A05 TaxID=1698259 RepID=A0A133UAL4_9EURY|nr:hypothetical protein AKJ57_02010 [candidate division MSBL1 archaeon SCGC-AAA259A05]
MPEVITIGEILVEVMRKEVGVPFKETSDFVGPYPSGAPAIFADAVARLGRSSGIIGGVGRDEFGEFILDRLREDGVDISRAQKSKDLSTGVAFVTYFSDGSRKFIYHMDNSAAGIINDQDVDKNYFEGATAVHINGSSLTMGKKMREACYRAVKIAVNENIMVSFDPNIRLELKDLEKTREIISPVFEVADVVTPNVEEIRWMTGNKNEEKAAKSLLKGGIQIVAVKRGGEGCELYTGDESLTLPPFDVEEVDPTGAGDAFSAAMVVGMMEEMPLEKLGRFANAVGGRAVTAKGAMEGLAKREEIEEMIKA